MRYGWIALGLAAALAGCSGAAGTVPNGGAGDASRTALGAGTPGTTGVWGQVVHAVPETLALSVCPTTAGTFDAEENFEGNVTAQVENGAIASVAPADQRNFVIPTAGGLKHAYFTVTPLAAGTTYVIVTDKKGNADRVSVTVTGCCARTSQSVRHASVGIIGNGAC